MQPVPSAYLPWENIRLWLFAGVVNNNLPRMLAAA